MIAPCAGHLVAAWTCAALAVAAVVGALVLRGIDDEPVPSAFAALGFAAFSIPALVAGVAIARKRPENAVGPIVAALGLIPALDVAFDAWAGAAVDGHVAGAGWAALLYDSDWIPVFGLLALLLLLFPDGRPPGPRWRWAVWLAIAAPVLVALVAAFRDEPFEAPYEDVAHPLPALPELRGRRPRRRRAGRAARGCGPRRDRHDRPLPPLARGGAYSDQVAGRRSHPAARGARRGDRSRDW